MSALILSFFTKMYLFVVHWVGFKMKKLIGTPTAYNAVVIPLDPV